MNILVGTVLIWAGALWCLHRLRKTAPEQMPEVFSQVWSLFLFMIPRIFAGLIGAGFLAALLPHDVVASAFGSEAGVLGILLGAICGALSPGGPFVALAIGAAALKAGCGAGALIAYVTGWCIFAVTRTMSYELPMLGVGFTRLRLVLSLPVPVILGVLAHLIELAGS